MRDAAPFDRCGRLLRRLRTPRNDGCRACEAGFALMENVIALAIVGIVVIGILSALAVAIVGTDKAYDRHILLEVAQSQLEDIQRQTYQTLASGYTLITAPDGYAIAVAVATPVAYTYPNASAPQQVLQQVTVTVTGVQGNLELVGYRRRE